MFQRYGHMERESPAPSFVCDERTSRIRWGAAGYVRLHMGNDQLNLPARRRRYERPNRGFLETGRAMALVSPSIYGGRSMPRPPKYRQRPPA
jgi:hypothetical protein